MLAGKCHPGSAEAGNLTARNLGSFSVPSSWFHLPSTQGLTAPSWVEHGAEGETLSEEGASRCPHFPRAPQPWAPCIPAAPVWKRSAFADDIDLEQQLGAASKGGFYGFTWRGKSPELENTAPTGTATSAGDPHPAGTEPVPAMATWLQLSGEQGQAERPGRARGEASWWLTQRHHLLQRCSWGIWAGRSTTSSRGARASSEGAADAHPQQAPSPGRSWLNQ